MTLLIAPKQRIDEPFIDFERSFFASRKTTKSARPALDLSRLAAPNTGCPREFTPRARTRLPYTPPLAPPNRIPAARPPFRKSTPVRATGRPRRLPHLRPMV